MSLGQRARVMAVINRCVLPLLVVLAAAACVTHGQERIKMCGRDLIRLAVTSCGSSRMRRSTAESQQGQLAGEWRLLVFGLNQSSGLC